MRVAFSWDAICRCARAIEYRPTNLFAQNFRNVNPSRGIEVIAYHCQCRGSRLNY